MAGSKRLTLGEVARLCGCLEWQVRRLFERGLLPPAERVGRNRVVVETELPAVRLALASAGYILRRSAWTAGRFSKNRPPCRRPSQAGRRASLSRKRRRRSGHGDGRERKGEADHVTYAAGWHVQLAYA